MLGLYSPVWRLLLNLANIPKLLRCCFFVFVWETFVFDKASFRNAAMSKFPIRVGFMNVEFVSFDTLEVILNCFGMNSLRGFPRELERNFILYNSLGTPARPLWA